MLENILILIVILIIPIIPTLVLYRYFPGKKGTFLKGPFKGFDIQLSGAFAGYFVILLFIGSFFMSLPKKELKYDLWEVKGKIKLEDGEFNTKDITISITPPDQNLTEDGRFWIEDVQIVKKKERPPQLLIHKSGYSNVSFFLEEMEKNAPGLSGYVIIYNRSKKVIDIKGDIILKKSRDGD